mgnify:CR=1 FL=1
MTINTKASIYRSKLPHYDRPSARVVIIGDKQPEGAHKVAEVAYLAQSVDADAIITCGDNSLHATDFEHLVGDYYEKPIMAVPGNHDEEDLTADAYQSYFYKHLPANGAKADYLTWHKGFGDCLRIFGLDSNFVWQDAENCENTSAEQQAWLLEQTAAAKEPWLFAVCHHPPYSNGYHGSTVGMQWGSSIGQPFAKLSGVFSGHEHHYERIMMGGLPYFVNGTGGSPLVAITETTIKPIAQIVEFGIIIIDANWGECSVKFVNLNGCVRDRIVFTR